MVDVQTCWLVTLPAVNPPTLGTIYKLSPNVMSMMMEYCPLPAANSSTLGTYMYMCISRALKSQNESTVFDK